MKRKKFSFGHKQARTGRVIEVARKDPDLERINHHAAGIDIGSESHFVAVPPESCPTPVKQFGVFTRDLYAIADWLQECGVKTVAMESTGVYWAAVVRGVGRARLCGQAGRSGQGEERQWPEDGRAGLPMAGGNCTVTGYWREPFARQMRSWCCGGIRGSGRCSRESAATHIQHMQKALQQMNLRLDNVVSDITGETGMRIMKAILGGERDVRKLGELRDRRCQASAEEIAESLVGNYRQEHLFSLKQAVELFEFYQAKIVECEAEMEKYLKSLPHKREDEPPPLPEGEKRNRLSFNVRDEAWKLTGVDLFRINGLNSETVLRITSEVGVDVASRFPTEKHFSSWLGLSPNNKITGGKVLSSKTKTSSNRAAAAFRQAAVSAERSQSEVGAFYRRKKAHLGPAQAVTATAHKIARIYYHLMKTGEEYVDGGAQASDQKYQERVLSNLKKRARGLGFELVALEQ